MNVPPSITSSRSDVVVIKSDIAQTPSGVRPAHARPRSDANGAPPKLSMNIDQTMKMDYAPIDDDVSKRKKKKVRKRNVEPRIPNGDAIVVHRQPDDDLAQYFSPAEDRDSDEGDVIPVIEHGSFLIKNSIDTTGAHRVIDVVESDSDSEYDVSNNVNLFDNHYLQSRENPMYASDPDLSRISRSHAKVMTSTPTWTKVFDDQTPPKKEKKNRKKEAFAHLEKQRYDTEIKVTRGQCKVKNPLNFRH